MNNIFEKPDALVPCIIQDARTHKVLMLGYMNEAAYKKTVAEKRVTFYSRSRKQLWTKGETSGNFLEVVEILPDCDKDTLLIKTLPAGPVCHTGADTCFGEANNKNILLLLEEIIQQRKNNPQANSYTTSLFQQGIKRIAQKVGEESVEVIIASQDENDEHFLNEAADLLYHFLVLLAARNKNLQEVEKILEHRHRKPH
jgi:phosphoribosyl-ATP pyrophosphohydrolase/phosphoribosyl-AMP cyclohydrolase